MNYYIIASPITVTENQWLSPFPEGPATVTHFMIASAIKEASKDGNKLILFTNLEEALLYAGETSQQTNNTVAAAYMEYPPVVEVTLKDINKINREIGALQISGFFPLVAKGSRSIELTNVDKIIAYHYQYGYYGNHPTQTIKLDNPLTLQELANANKPIILQAFEHAVTSVTQSRCTIQ